MCDFISGQVQTGQLTILVTDPAVVPPDSLHQIEIMASVVGFASLFNILRVNVSLEGTIAEDIECPTQFIT